MPIDVPNHDAVAYYQPAPARPVFGEYSTGGRTANRAEVRVPVPQVGERERPARAEKIRRHFDAVRNEVGQTVGEGVQMARSHRGNRPAQETRSHRVVLNAGAVREIEMELQRIRNMQISAESRADDDPEITELNEEIHLACANLVQIVSRHSGLADRYLDHPLLQPTV